MHVVGMKGRGTHKGELHFRQIGLAAELVLNKLRLATQLEEPISDRHTEADTRADSDKRGAERNDDVQNSFAK